MYLNLILALIAALLLGISKGGLKGLGIVIVALLAYVYGAKSSVGILVPLLIVGDILAVIWFKKHVKVKYLIQFLPSMAVGVLLAVWLGNDLDEATFKKWISAIILLSTVWMFWTEYKTVNYRKPGKLMTLILGLSAGFTTMIGNLAGPFSNLYFLAARLPKKQIIGTAAWVFFIINIFKVPFHVLVWKTINVESLMVDLTLVPAVIVGFFIGVKLVDKFSEINYRRFLLFVTALGAVLVLLS